MLRNSSARDFKQNVSMPLNGHHSPHAQARTARLPTYLGHHISQTFAPLAPSSDTCIEIRTLRIDLLPHLL